MHVLFSGKGDLFGSDIDFNDPISVCNYDVRSLTYSELQCINIKGKLISNDIFEGFQYNADKGLIRVRSGTVWLCVVNTALLLLGQEDNQEEGSILF